MTLEDNDIIRDDDSGLVASDDWCTFTIKPTELYQLATEIYDELLTLPSIKLSETDKRVIEGFNLGLPMVKEELEALGGLRFNVMKELILAVKYLIGLLVKSGYPRWAIRVLDYTVPNCSMEGQ